MNKHKEIRFEEAIEVELLARGYQQGDAHAYDAERALFPDDVVAFIQASQPKKWQALADVQGVAAQETLLRSLTKELTAKGVLHVLRHGFKCFGKTFALAAFAPASGVNPAVWAEYQKNILRVTCQVHFSPKHPELSIDVLLSVNGLPVATMELKNPMLGQNVEHAKRQYQFDRDPREPLFKFKERALVHFAVDPDLVFMSAKLAGKETMVFPRYHQLDAVRKLVAHSKAHGSGHNYLVQHSAGSGKSNSIAWLAHHLASLHDAQDQKVFH